MEKIFSLIRAKVRYHIEVLVLRVKQKKVDTIEKDLMWNKKSIKDNYKFICGMIEEKVQLARFGRKILSTINQRITKGKLYK
jgi:hypothetical protein